ncbi:glycosyltransferase family 25 protein [Asaia krungthepensis]|uniref:Glycosyltransferase n=1 Tax=Asaia krungthepensis NRIC 0535 TaxID=1307925 RepID=A0ABQ0Q0W0_9PROT|nr:glycosyltransferase family 25 protein [Asaia krungthepensis]GBQ86382.1 glycosyltransferase [Asaia krungthepensis NRIC 0535]
MRKLVINRACDTARLSAFMASNAHIASIKRVEGTEGASVPLASLVERGMADPGLVYTPGAIGAALSHLGLWSRAVQQGEPLMIFEDDALLCQNFETESARLIATLPPDWDIALLGYNFNAPITLDALPGVTRSVVTLDEKRMQKNAAFFPLQDRHASFFRLLQGFGLCAYAISPKGARRLLECCLPLRAQEYQQLGLDRMVRNVGIDVVTSYYFSQIDAYGAFPPLAISPNDKTLSTISRAS